MASSTSSSATLLEVSRQAVGTLVEASAKAENRKSSFLVVEEHIETREMSSQLEDQTDRWKYFLKSMLSKNDLLFILILYFPVLVILKMRNCLLLWSPVAHLSSEPPGRIKAFQGSFTRISMT